MTPIPIAIEDSIRRVPIEMAMQELGWTQDKDFLEHHTFTWVHDGYPNQQFMLSEAIYQELKKTRKELVAKRDQAKRLHTLAVGLICLAAGLLVGICYCIR